MGKGVRDNLKDVVYGGEGGTGWYGEGAPGVGKLRLVKGSSTLGEASYQVVR